MKASEDKPNRQPRTVTIPISSTALSDPRFLALGAKTGTDTGEAFYRCMLLWAECYKRRFNVLPRFLVANWYGEPFCEALCEVKLATAIGSLLRIAGVHDRLERKLSLAERASMGGLTAGNGRPKSRLQATASVGGGGC